jgi:unsaturated rhamnogalacturonyl hydrolase
VTYQDDDRLERVLVALLALQRQSWEQGLAAQAARDLGRRDLALLLARAAVERQAPDGGLGDVDGESGAVNGAACIEGVAHAAAAQEDGRWSSALDRQLRWLVSEAPRAGDGTLFHLRGERQVWADTVYMVVPGLALVGRTDLAAAQVTGHRLRLHDPVSHLYAAQWDEVDGSLLRPQHWGTGNGWVVAGIARALRIGRGWSDSDRTALAAHAREVLDACLALRRDDGLFHDVLDDPTSFREGNLAQMLAYAALTGAADGWLPAAYAASGADLLSAAGTLVDDAGLVREVCGSPHFDRPGISAEAQAFHLLAAAALRSYRDRGSPGRAAG